jgi:hypothetical protein
MPQYYFDLADETAARDELGADLPNDDLARHYAMGLAETLMGRPGAYPSSAETHVIIKDRNGKALNMVRSADLSLDCLPKQD